MDILRMHIKAKGHMCTFENQESQEQIKSVWHISQRGTRDYILRLIAVCGFS